MKGLAYPVVARVPAAPSDEDLVVLLGPDLATSDVVCKQDAEKVSIQQAPPT